MCKELSPCSLNKLLELAIGAARQAGCVAMRYYRQAIVVERKQDGSPLTLADQEAHQVIVSQLAETGLIVVSEEGEDMRLAAERYWLVDPLDGTKDFLARNDEFTINIALVDQSRPVLGVIYAPAFDDLFWGVVGMGAQRIRQTVSTPLKIHARAPSCRMAVSRFHDHPDVEAFAAQNGIRKRVAIGSALKYGLLAAAEVDVFPRLVGSSEWDTAAGQAIVEAVGGAVLDWNTGQPLRYGKKHRRNPRLLSIRAPYNLAEFNLKDYQEELL